MTNADIPALLARFLITDNHHSFSWQPFGSGYIHDTFLVKTPVNAGPDYILQRLNHLIFKNIPGLMRNIQLVTDHIREKLRQQTGTDPDRQVLTLIPTRTGELYLRDEQGNYWRLYRFIENSKSYDQIRTPQQARAGGQAFGAFQALLADFPADQLTETLPQFHDLSFRMQNYQAALAADVAGRARNILLEQQFVEKRAPALLSQEKEAAAILPQRVTHNDTKFNNVLFDENDQALCVVDLDTVMPGYLHYDFGDAVRSSISPAPEDEPDLTKIKLDLDVFSGFTTGFLSATRSFITVPEVNYLYYGCQLFPFLMGIRFLTDYLQGDIYYKTLHSEHNIQRTRAQFELLCKIEAHADQMQTIIRQQAQINPSF